MLCFTTETAVGGRAGRWFQTAGAGYVRATLALCSRYARAMFTPVRLGPHCSGRVDVLHKSSVRIIFVECNCRLLDAL